MQQRPGRVVVVVVVVGAASKAQVTLSPLIDVKPDWSLAVQLVKPAREIAQYCCERFGYQPGDFPVTCRISFAFACLIPMSVAYRSRLMPD